MAQQKRSLVVEKLVLINYPNKPRLLREQLEAMRKMRERYLSREGSMRCEICSAAPSCEDCPWTWYTGRTCGHAIVIGEPDPSMEKRISILIEVRQNPELHPDLADQRAEQLGEWITKLAEVVKRLEGGSKCNE